jgi:hypothetical protein
MRSRKMKIVITALSWTVLALGVCSTGLAQNSFDPYGDGASQSDDTLWRNVLLIGDESPGSAPSPTVSTGDFPEPIGDYNFASCGNACCGCNSDGCCRNVCNDSGFLSGWNVKIAPYMWLSEIHGDATVGGITQNLHVSTRDLLDLMEHDAHFFFAGKLELEQEQGPLGLIVNGYYLNAGLADDIKGFSFFKKFEQAIVDVAFTYELEGMADTLHLPDCSQFELLAGFRYWMFDTGVRVNGPFGRIGTGPFGIGRFDGKSEWVDPIIGGRIIVPLKDRSNLQVRGDIGGFDWGTASHFTWNFEALIEICCSDAWAIRGGYRILDVDHTKGVGNKQLGFDVQYRGPVAELVFVF